MRNRGMGGLLGAGAVIVLGLGAAGLIEDRMAWRRCVGSAEALVAHQRNQPTSQTVGEVLAERHPDAPGWKMESVADGDVVTFETANGPEYVWHCSDDNLAFVTASSDAAGALTPFRRRLERILEDTRNARDLQAPSAHDPSGEASAGETPQEGAP